MREIHMRQIRDLKCTKCGARNKRIYSKFVCKENNFEKQHHIVCCNCGYVVDMVEPNPDKESVTIKMKIIDQCWRLNNCENTNCPHHQDYTGENKFEQIEELTKYPIKPIANFSDSVQLKINEIKNRFR